MLKQIFAVHGDYTLEISCRNLHVELPIVYLQGRTFREFLGGGDRLFNLATLAWISVVCTLSEKFPFLSDFLQNFYLLINHLIASWLLSK
jgi:hypothetical protein